MGRHRHRAEPGAGIPGQQRFGAVVQVDQYALAAAHAALVQAAGDAADTVVEFSVADALRRAVEGRPDDERMVASRPRTLLEQPGHVHAHEGVCVGAGEQEGHVGSWAAGCQVSRLAGVKPTGMDAHAG
jgi:hypothetical protein